MVSRSPCPHSSRRWTRSLRGSPRGGNGSTRRDGCLGSLPHGRTPHLIQPRVEFWRFDSLAHARPRNTSHYRRCRFQFERFNIFAERSAGEKYSLGGGGARSPLWRQIQADVYSQEVECRSGGRGPLAAIPGGGETLALRGRSLRFGCAGCGTRKPDSSECPAG
jgi:hypothetical protein